MCSTKTYRTLTAINIQSIFYFMSVHIEVILDNNNNTTKQTKQKTYSYYLY